MYKGLIIVFKFVYNFFGMSNFFFLLVGCLPEGRNQIFFFILQIYIFIRDILLYG